MRILDNNLREHCLRQFHSVLFCVDSKFVIHYNHNEKETLIQVVSYSILELIYYVLNKTLNNFQGKLCTHVKGV